ncbi:unnamed protein product [Vitrella brassicaformis CCMP3155]|uniref:indole-3-glycerol-phosphate synthase n=1 Tax=Vitrella brassicaformis (strain CCMP3155) TaxID=1169540 RepID=A0A0G4F0L6_VITBC|nr:unnamed protein product [Vitrella brassicaformis CCMP3155]|eukprot:CEM04600.1 unnamed protein product [Vitrella brassicaformis CCMP3155]
MQRRRSWRRQNVVRMGSDGRDPQAPWDMFARMIEAKKAEVKRLVEEHSSDMDPLMMRLQYVRSPVNIKISESLRPPRNDSDFCHKLTMIADLKRESPTHPDPSQRRVLSYSDASEMACALTNMGFDAIFVNTDQSFWGGSYDDIRKIKEEFRVRGVRFSERPAIIAKDLMLHPLQMAYAVEMGADGVVLNSLLLGQDMEHMMEAAIVMGCETVVEVHTQQEADDAVKQGANIIMVNQWDRVDGRLSPLQAGKLRDRIHPEVITIVAGGIQDYKQISDIGMLGYDSVVLGRKLADEDVPQLVDRVRAWEGPPRLTLTMGMGRAIRDEVQQDMYY